MLTDARVLVTGAGRRVGRAIALELARAGCHVAIHYLRSRGDAETLAAEIRRLGRVTVTVPGDLNEPRSWRDIIEQAVRGLGGLDILINNASRFLTGEPDTVDGFTPEAWERMLRINLTAPAALCCYARPHLAAGGRGRIINLSDIGAVRPWKDHFAYCVSKSGLDALTRALAVALAPGITVNGIAPGIAVFPDEFPPPLRERLTSRVPVRRVGTPEEVAGLTRRVLESGSYLTGQIIALDGGRGLV